MSYQPVLTRVDRAQRHRRIVEAYQSGLCSRTVAVLFDLSDSHVRHVVNLYEVSRPVGRPRRAQAG